jgi:hypothetical protein
MNQIATIPEQKKSILATMASRYSMEPQAFESTVRATCMKPDKNGRIPSREEFAAFLLVAKEYNLNPLTKEIYAFPDKSGGIQPIVSIDGWMNLINSHPQYDGMQFEDIHDGKNLVAIKCKIYRKDRTYPVEITEYMEECLRGTEPWRKWPARMLRHKAAIQCARYAFGFSGIIEPDEYERQEIKDITPPPPPTHIAPPPPLSKQKEPVQAEPVQIDLEAILDDYESRMEAHSGDAAILKEIKAEFESDNHLTDEEREMLNDQFIGYMQELP